MKSLMLLACLLLASCAGVKSPVSGIIFTKVKATEHSSEFARGTKTGTACAESYLSLVALGDASVEAAMKAGKITKLTHVDYTADTILVYGKYCTIAYGN